MNKKTRILHEAAARDKQTGALSVPVYHASTYHQADIEKTPQWEYGRSANPTRFALEELLAALEGAAAGFAFSSGMAAVTAAITSFVNSGDHIVATRDIYGGSYRFLTGYLNRFGVTHTFVDTTDPQNVQNALLPNTKVLFLESPSNPLLKITDLEAMVGTARKRNILTIIDSTFLTPYFLQPMALGIDVCVHSATKFLGGHSDLIAGAVMTRTPELAKAVKFVQNTCGNILSPNDSWLLIRGIKTLSARLDAQSKSAMILARWLSKQSWVSEVFYPGLESHPGYDIITKQASGYGAVVSVKIDTVERVFKIMKNVRLWNVAVSLGGVESILSYPSKMSHAAIPETERHALGISDNLIRLSIGLEDVEDLINDLQLAAK